MGGTTVVNNLTSTSTSSALSANMGRELNEKIEAIDIRVETLENNEGSSSNCETRIWTQ